jgi:hypothetical protein
MAQRREDRDRGIEPGEYIDQRHADAIRFAADRAGDAHQAAHALDHEIIARFVRAGTILAETGDRAINQRRIDRLE